MSQFALTFHEMKHIPLDIAIIYFCAQGNDIIYRDVILYVLDLVLGEQSEKKWTIITFTHTV